MLESIRKHLDYIIFIPVLIISSLIIGTNLFDLILGRWLPLTTIITVILYTGYESYKSITQGKVSEEITSRFSDFSTGQQTMISDLQDVKKIQDEIKKSLPEKEKRFDKTNLLVDLINEQLIPIQVVEKTIIDKKFITVFYSTAGFSTNIPKIIKDMEDKSEFTSLKEYLKIFDELGFLQLSSGRPTPYFIIAEDNLYPEKLRDINSLADYIFKRANQILINQWNLIMKKAKDANTRFYKLRENTQNPLNFNILVIKASSRNILNRFKIKNDFNPKFITQLTSLSDILKVGENISRDQKIKIRNFVLKSSIDILILKVPKTDRLKISSLESVFREPKEEKGLGIEHFYDYCMQNREDISDILRTKFSDETKINKYTDMIQRNSKAYKDALIELGVALD